MSFEKRLERIAPRGRAMILAYDQGFEHGPRDFKDNPQSSDPSYIIRLAQQGGFSGVVLHAGIAEKYQKTIKEAKIPLILKLNGRSELYTGDDPYSPQLYSVKDAISLGAAAVGYTVYSGSKYENQMNQEFAQIIREAHQKGIPAVGWMYPRGRSLKEGVSPTSEMAIQEKKEAQEDSLAIDETPSIVAYGARIGMELGADMVKIKYTGSVESFRWVVQCARPTLVVMSGGHKTKTDQEFLERVKDILKAGAIGIAVGRNVWQRENALEIAHQLHQIIFGGL